MIRTVMSCNECKIDQLKVNGWFALWTNEMTLSSCHVKDLEHLNAITAQGTQTIGGSIVHHACGSECAAKMYQRWLATGQLIAGQPLTYSPPQEAWVHPIKESEKS